MTEAQQLAARVRAVATRSGVSAATLSRKLFGNGKRLEEIEAGGSLTLAKYAEAVAQLEALERAA